MKLWLLKPIEEPDDWDIYIGFVVRAESELAARMCSSAVLNRYEVVDPTDWLDPKQVTCEEVEADGPEGIILDSFKAG